MPVAVFTQTTISAGQCFLAAISVANSWALSAKADLTLGIGTESMTISEDINFRMNSLQSMKFSLWNVPTTPRLKIDQKPSIVLV